MLSTLLVVGADGELDEGKGNDGEFKNPRKFVVGTTRFQWMKEQVVISMSPYIPFSEDDDRLRNPTLLRSWQRASFSCAPPLSLFLFLQMRV